MKKTPCTTVPDQKLESPFLGWRLQSFHLSLCSNCNHCAAAFCGIFIRRQVIYHCPEMHHSPPSPSSTTILPFSPPFPSSFPFVLVQFLAWSTQLQGGHWKSASSPIMCPFLHFQWKCLPQSAMEGKFPCFRPFVLPTLFTRGAGNLTNKIRF